MAERRGILKKALAVVESESPFDDVDDSKGVDLRPEPTRQSVQSFWLAVAGLAILALLSGVALTLTISHYQYVVFGRVYELIGLKGYYDWQTAALIRALITESFVPSIVIASVIPILYWRGNLIQRFVISLLIAVTELNMVGSNYWEITFHYLKTLLPGLFAICLCWIALPILFSKTPIRTKQLRLVVATAIFILAFCVSMLHMDQAADNERYLYWEVFYAVAFGIALFRRNWGNLAALEATATKDQIETTSSRTLMEMMVVGSLACVAAMYWSVRPDTVVLLDLGTAAGLALISVLLSVSTIVRHMERRSSIASSLFVWCSVGFYFAVSILLVNIAQYSRYSITINWLAIFVVIVMAFVVSALFVLYLYLVGRWLRFCGWTFAK